MRTTGYYWVRFEGSQKWEIGHYHAKTQRWELLRTTTHWKDSEFIEINETEIKQPC